MKASEKPLQSNGEAAAAPPAGIHAPLDAWLQSNDQNLVRFRRRLHATPEPSGRETATTALVVESLRHAGLEPMIMADSVGVVVDVTLNPESDSFIALRCELDCVGVGDDKQVPYASTRPGLCHACGHDAHTTIVLHAALAAHELRQALAQHAPRRNLRFIFQPAEETAVGARSMINQNALAGVDAIIAVHVDPHRPVGTVGLRKGPLTSGAKGFEITIRGRGGHSARPHEAIDPLPAAVNIASMFYQLCPRFVDSRHPVVLTVGSIIGGTAANAIPDTAVMQGTLRSAYLEDMELVQRRMEDIVEGVRQATGCAIDMRVPYHAPPTDNDSDVIDAMAAAGVELLGTENVLWIDEPSLGAEDFAFYQELIPGAIVRLGTAGSSAATRWPLHSPRFDIDERALPLGVQLLLRSALRLAQP